MNVGANTHACLFCGKPNSAGSTSAVCVECKALVLSVKQFIKSLTGIVLP